MNTNILVSLKRNILLLVSIILITIPFSTLSMAASTDIKIIINGTTQKFDTSPILVNGSVLVPMRAIFEKLGVTVNWNNSNKQITATKDFSKITLIVGSKIATINNSKTSLNVVPQMIKGNTMVPLRFVGEALEADVKWDVDIKTVNIKFKSKWERLDATAIKSTNQFGTSYIIDWSPDNILTAVSTESGIVQNIEGTWVQFDADNSPVKNLKINNFKWSNNGKLAVVARNGGDGLDYIWLYSNKVWEKINLPRVTIQMGKPLKDYVIGPTSNEFLYLDWSSDNVLTASFGVSTYGVSFMGLWQYKDNEWNELYKKRDEEIGLIEDVIYNGDDVYISDHLSRTWLYRDNKLSPISTSEDTGVNKFFVTNGKIFGLPSGETGILKYENNKWSSANGIPNDIQNAWLDEAVYSQNNVAVSSPNDINLMWLLRDGYWSKLSDNALPFTYREPNIKVPEGYRLADGAYASFLSLSPSGKQMTLMTLQDIRTDVSARPFKQYLWLYNME